MTAPEHIPPSRYNGGMIALHWLSAVMVAALWIIGQVIDVFPRDSMLRGAMRSSHILLGLSLFVIVLLRLAWRRLSRHRIPPPEPGWMGRAGGLMHLALYALLLVLVIGGPLNAWVRGDSVFGLFQFTAPAPDARWLRGLVGEVHELAANTILVLAGMHAVAALLHHLLLRDDTLRRMLPGRPRAT